MKGEMGGLREEKPKIFTTNRLRELRRIGSLRSTGCFLTRKPKGAEREAHGQERGAHSAERKAHGAGGKVRGKGRIANGEGRRRKAQSVWRGGSKRPKYAALRTEKPGNGGSCVDFERKVITSLLNKYSFF